MSIYVTNHIPSASVLLSALELKYVCHWWNFIINGGGDCVEKNNVLLVKTYSPNTVIVYPIFVSFHGNKQVALLSEHPLIFLYINNISYYIICCQKIHSWLHGKIIFCSWKLTLSNRVLWSLYLEISRREALLLECLSFINIYKERRKRMEMKDFDLFSKLLGLSIKRRQKIGW